MAAIDRIDAAIDLTDRDAQARIEARNQGGTVAETTTDMGWGQRVEGVCPACRLSSLFLGDGGYVTCANLRCSDPGAASDLLERHSTANHVAVPVEQLEMWARMFEQDNQHGSAINVRRFIPDLDADLVAAMAEAMWRYRWPEADQGPDGAWYEYARAALAAYREAQQQ